MTIYDAKVHFVKSSHEVATEISKLLGTDVTPEQFESIKALMFGVAIQLRSQNNRPALYYENRLTVESFEANTAPIGEGKDIVLRLSRRKIPGNEL